MIFHSCEKAKKKCNSYKFTSTYWSLSWGVIKGQEPTSDQDQNHNKSGLMGLGIILILKIKLRGNGSEKKNWNIQWRKAC